MFALRCPFTPIYCIAVSVFMCYDVSCEPVFPGNPQQAKMYEESAAREDCKLTCKKLPLCPAMMFDREIKCRRAVTVNGGGL